MDNDNVVTPHLIRWTPGVREIDTYLQDPTPENLDRVIHYFKKRDGENNLATKLLSATLPLFLRLESLIPHQLLGDRAKGDPRVLRVALFGLCGETTNRWSADLIDIFGNPDRIRELLFPAMDDRGEIRPSLMRWDPEGPLLDSCLESSTKENLDRLLYYLTEQHQVFINLFSVTFPHLVGIQDQVFSSVGNEFPWQDITQSRKGFFVLSAEMSSKWAVEYTRLCMNPALIYEGLRSLLDQVFPAQT